MSFALALFQSSLHDVPAELLRTAMVCACALALILAGNALPI
jgi:hypothetical protein